MLDCALPASCYWHFPAKNVMAHTSLAHNITPPLRRAAATMVPTILIHPSPNSHRCLSSCVRIVLNDDKVSHNRKGMVMNSTMNPLATEVTPLTPRQQDETPPKPQRTVYLLIALLACLFIAMSARSFVHGPIHEDSLESNVQKIFVVQPSPKFYLPVLNREAISRQQPKEGLRWGIVGLGRIAHDFTSA